MKLKLISLIFLSLSLLSRYIKADLPVHCLKSEIVGQWDFYVDPTLYNLDLNDPRVSCSNGFPNKYVIIHYFMFQINILRMSYIFKLTLSSLGFFNSIVRKDGSFSSKISGKLISRMITA